jgi:hypothetical protein
LVGALVGSLVGCWEGGGCCLCCCCLVLLLVVLVLVLVVGGEGGVVGVARRGEWGSWWAPW